MANLSFNFTLRQTVVLLFLAFNLVSAAFIPRKLTRPQLDQTQTQTHPIVKRNPLLLPVPQDFLEIVPTPPAGGGEAAPTPPPETVVVPTPPPGGVEVVPTPPPEAVPTPPPGGGEVLVPSPPPEAVTPLPEPVTPLPPAVTPIGPAITPIPDSGAGSGGIGETPVVVTPAAAKRTDGPRVVKRKLKLF